MDRAIDRRNGGEHLAITFSDLPSDQRSALRAHLKCPFCEASAHFRKASRPSAGRSGRVAHFYCVPHGIECDITRRVEDPWETEDSDRAVALWEQRDITLIVRIPRPGDEEDVNIDEPEGTGERESRAGLGGDRTHATRSVVRGPQKLLEQLVHWPSFKTSSARLRLPDPNHTEVPVHDAFVRFESANVDAHTDRWYGFWGVVRPFIFFEPHNTYYSNFGPRNSDFRIAIDRVRLAEVLARYRLANIGDLAGNYLLLFDRGRVSQSGRFMVDVNSVEHVGFLRVT